MAEPLKEVLAELAALSNVAEAMSTSSQNLARFASHVADEFSGKIAALTREAAEDLELDRITITPAVATRLTLGLHFLTKRLIPLVTALEQFSSLPSITDLDSVVEQLESALPKAN